MVRVVQSVDECTLATRRSLKRNEDKIAQLRDNVVAALAPFAEKEKEEEKEEEEEEEERVMRDVVMTTIRRFLPLCNINNNNVINNNDEDEDGFVVDNKEAFFPSVFALFSLQHGAMRSVIGQIKRVAVAAGGDDVPRPSPATAGGERVHGEPPRAGKGGMCGGKDAKERKRGSRNAVAMSTCAGEDLDFAFPTMWDLLNNKDAVRVQIEALLMMHRLHSRMEDKRVFPLVDSLALQAMQADGKVVDKKALKKMAKVTAAFGAQHGEHEKAIAELEMLVARQEALVAPFLAFAPTLIEHLDEEEAVMMPLIARISWAAAARGVRAAVAVLKPAEWEWLVKFTVWNLPSPLARGHFFRSLVFVWPKKEAHYRALFANLLPLAEHAKVCEMNRDLDLQV